MPVMRDVPVSYGSDPPLIVSYPRVLAQVRHSRCAHRGRGTFPASQNISHVLTPSRTQTALPAESSISGPSCKRIVVTLPDEQRDENGGSRSGGGSAETARALFTRWTE
jgi:hypothetical protein